MSKPFTQGEFDGLCGLYSIVNAFKLLFPRKKLDDFEELAKELALSIPQNEFRSVFIDGMDFRRLEILVQRAVKFAKNKWNGDVEFQTNKFIANRKDVFFKEMNSYFRGEGSTKYRRAVILGLSGRMEHWTTAEDATENTMFIFDKGFKQVNKGQAIVGEYASKFELDSKEVIMVQKLKKKKNK